MGDDPAAGVALHVNALSAKVMRLGLANSLNAQKRRHATQHMKVKTPARIEFLKVSQTLILRQGIQIESRFGRNPNCGHSIEQKSADVCLPSEFKIYV